LDRNHVFGAANTGNNCGFKCGELPNCAPLATTNVPLQQENSPKYGSCEALSRGTLFPGLDLPFMNKANTTHPYAGTPLGEIMALDFMVKELNLYLDTHKDDADAFELLQNTIILSNECREKYVKEYGPICIKDLEKAKSYNWLKSPWPWEYTERSCK